MERKYEPITIGLGNQQEVGHKKPLYPSKGPGNSKCINSFTVLGEKRKEEKQENKSLNELNLAFRSHFIWNIWQNFGCGSGPVHSFALLDYSKREQNSMLSITKYIQRQTLNLKY